MSKSSLNSVNYGKIIESALKQIRILLKGDYTISKHALGLLLLQEDPEIQLLIQKQEITQYEAINQVVQTVKAQFAQPLYYIITLKRTDAAANIIR